MIGPALFVSLLLAQGSTTMAGPSVATRGAAEGGGPVADFFTEFFTTPAAQCDGSAVTGSGGESLVVDRASSAYCTRADGVLVLVDADEPRLSNSGVLIEGERTNLRLQWMALGNGAWGQFNTTVTDNQGVFPDGNTTLDEVAGGVNNAVLYQTANVSGTGPWTSSVYGVKASGSGFSTVTATCDSTAIPDSCTCATTSGACTAAVGGGGSDVCNGWSDIGTTGERLSISYTCPTAQTASTSGISPSKWTVTSETSILGGAQFEEGPFASSYIPTTGTPVMRAADNYSFEPSRDISAEGCVRATVTFPPVVAPFTTLLGFEGGLGGVFSMGTDLNLTDNGSSVTIELGDLSNQTLTVRASWGGSTMTIETESASDSSEFFLGDMHTGTVWFGSNQGDSNFLYGHLKDVRFGTSSTGCAL